MDNQLIPTPPEVTVVIPFFNEEENIHWVVSEVRKVLDREAQSWELILVNDGSRDNTWPKIMAEGEEDPRIKCIGLSRNFGHQHALLAGLTASTGQTIISMDGDMQHPPEIISDLLAHWRQGMKIVTTRRRYGEAAGYWKKLTSRYFYLLFSKLAEVPLEEGSSDFRLLDREVLDVILNFKDANMFLRGAVCWVGYPCTVVEFQAAERKFGESKYNFARMFRFAWAALLSFSTKPLRIGIWIGVLTSFLAFMEIMYVLIQYFRGNTVAGWTSLIALMSLLFGILFIVIGIIGSYIANIHNMLQARPRFIVNKMSENDVNGIKRTKIL
jgi:dolichol-phosphate mannosyltransferase